MNVVPSNGIKLGEEGGVIDGRRKGSRGSGRRGAVCGGKGTFLPRM